MSTNTPKDTSSVPYDQINHPAHYGGDTVYEAIKVIEAWGLSFCLGNAVKYICRAGRKNPHIAGAKLEDLRKAHWYLEHEIMRLEKLQHPVVEANLASTE